MDEDHQQVLSFDDHRNHSNCGKEKEVKSMEGTTEQKGSWPGQMNHPD